MLKRYLHLFGVWVLLLFAVAGCQPSTTRMGAISAEAVRNQTDHVTSDEQSLVFPTGDKLVARTDIAATVRDGFRVADAVVITDDDRAYVGLHLLSGHTLTTGLVQQIRRTVERLTLGGSAVYVTANDSAFSDLRVMERYLTEGRTVGGMLLTWRSMLRKTWGLPNLTSSNQ